MVGQQNDKLGPYPIKYCKMIIGEKNAKMDENVIECYGWFINDNDYVLRDC